MNKLIYLKRTTNINYNHFFANETDKIIWKCLKDEEFIVLLKMDQKLGVFSTLFTVCLNFSVSKKRRPKFKE